MNNFSTSRDKGALWYRGGQAGLALTGAKVGSGGDTAAKVSSAAEADNPITISFGDYQSIASIFNAGG